MLLTQTMGRGRFAFCHETVSSMVRRAGGRADGDSLVFFFILSPTPSPAPSNPMLTHFAFPVVLRQPSAYVKKMPKFLSKDCPFRTTLASQIVTA